MLLGMSPGEVLDKHTSRELTEWMVYLQLEPAGEERSDLRAGIIASTVANAHRDPKKTKPFKPEDFMPKLDAAEEDHQSADDMRAAARTLTETFGGGRSN